MRAITVRPGVANSARLDDIPAPPASDGTILARTLALGVCATDREIVAGDYGATPPGEDRLVLSHESLGHVVEAPPGSGFAPGHAFKFDVGSLNRSMVLNNETVFGTVNANRRHYELAAEGLARANKNWLAGLITRRVPVAQWARVLERRPGDIKVIVDFAA